MVIYFAWSNAAGKIPYTHETKMAPLENFFACFFCAILMTYCVNGKLIYI